MSNPRFDDESVAHTAMLSVSELVTSLDDLIEVGEITLPLYVHDQLHTVRELLSELNYT